MDILADKGISQLKPLKEKLEHLSQEEQDLTREEKRLEQEINAEKRQAGSAHDQIQTLNLFNDIFTLNQNHPERIKMILPRFVNYVVCHMADKKKGIGRLDVGLFGRPFANGENGEIWNDCLQEIAKQCGKSVQASGKLPAGNGNEGAYAPIHSARVLPGPEPACGTECVPVRGRVSNGVRY